jgi:DNA-directed RNA polymerase specialized sigma24 family protein
MRHVGGSGGAPSGSLRELKAGARAVPPAEDDSYQLPEPLIDVLRALWRLSPNQREAVILHDYADPGTRL